MKSLRLAPVLAAFIAVALAARTLPAADPVAAPPALKTTEFGHGPTIVLVHGLGAARATWMQTARKLLATNHVVMVDLPGHGDSPLPDPFTLDVAAEAIGRTLAAQKAESTIVVGQGIGGLLAMMTLSAHPERARGVVVIDAALRPETPVPDQRQKFFLQMLDTNYDNFLQMMFMRAGRDSAQGVLLHAQASQIPPATIKAYLRELLHMDGSKAFKDLKRPMLYVGTEKGWPADKDWAAIAHSHGYEGADSLPHARIGGSGPLVASERPDSLAAVLTSFAGTAIAKK